MNGQRERADTYERQSTSFGPPRPPSDFHLKLGSLTYEEKALIQSIDLEQIHNSNPWHDDFIHIIEKIGLRVNGLPSARGNYISIQQEKDGQQIACRLTQRQAVAFLKNALNNTDTMREKPKNGSGERPKMFGLDPHDIADAITIDEGVKKPEEIKGGVTDDKSVKKPEIKGGVTEDVVRPATPIERAIKRVQEGGEYSPTEPAIPTTPEKQAELERLKNEIYASAGVQEALRRFAGGTSGEHTMPNPEAVPVVHEEVPASQDEVQEVGLFAPEPTELKRVPPTFSEVSLEEGETRIDPSISEPAGESITTKPETSPVEEMVIEPIAYVPPDFKKFEFPDRAARVAEARESALARARALLDEENVEHTDEDRGTDLRETVMTKEMSASRDEAFVPTSTEASVVPEHIKSDTLENLVSEPVYPGAIELFDRNFGIRSEDLEKIKGFSILSPAQQHRVFESLKAYAAQGARTRGAYVWRNVKNYFVDTPGADVPIQGSRGFAPYKAKLTQLVREINH